jgi:hypothetical protein
MKLTVKLDFGGGHEIKVGTFSEIARDTAFEFAVSFFHRDSTLHRFVCRRVVD